MAIMFIEGHIRLTFNLKVKMHFLFYNKWSMTSEVIEGYSFSFCKKFLWFFTDFDNNLSEW